MAHNIYIFGGKNHIACFLNNYVIDFNMKLLKFVCISFKRLFLSMSHR